jgi:hypothetical protein
MNRIFSRRSKYTTFFKGLGIALTLMLVVQAVAPGAFAINSAFAEQPENPGGENGSAGEMVNICHRDGGSGNWNAITVNENAVNGHIGSHHQDDMDYIVSDEDLGESEFNDQYCADNAPTPPADETGSLTVTKVVVGTSTPASDFDLFVNGMPIMSGVASTSIAVGSYTITEEDDARFEASFSGDCNSSGVVHVEDGEDATCTITNTWLGGTGGAGDEEATLTVTKVVVGGDMEVNDFPLFLNGMSITSGISTTTSTGTSTVTETSDPDYNGVFSGDCNSLGQVHLNDGQTKSCTLTNTFIGTSTGTSTSPFMVKIYKYLDGEQATASTSGNYEFPMVSSWDWTDTEGNHNGTGNFYLGLTGHGGSAPYQAFTSLMTGPADYATHEITSDIASSSQVLPIGAQCNEGMFRLEGYKTGTTLAGALASSLSTTSPSFTDINSERYIVVMNESCPDTVPTPSATGTIVVNKIVINDNGGTGTTTNFSFSLDSGTSTAFEADGSNSLVVATGTHNVVETAAAGYSTTYDGCSNINVAGGDTHTCTITNNDIGTTTGTTTGNIIVNKIVINNNNGTSTASSFPLFVGTTSVVMGATTTLPLGTYTVSETYNPDLYAQSFSGNCNSSGVVTLSATTTVTCTITNHDIPQQCPVTQGVVESDTNTTVQGGGNAVLLSFVHPAWTADVDGASTTAKWIWSTNPVATTTATTTVTFNRTFTVVGTSTSATLNIASDNTYRIWINGVPVATSTDGNNFTLATQDSYNVSSFLVNGVNTLTIEVTNEATPDVTDPAGNPAGLLYSLSWTANNCPVDNGQGGNGGGEVAGVTTTSDNDNNHKHRSRTIVRGINSTIEDNTPNGQVLGINTDNLIPLGQVLGINSTLPGLPNTGLGPILNKAAQSSGLPIIAIGLLALGGLYMLQFRLLKRR